MIHGMAVNIIFGLILLAMIVAVVICAKLGLNGMRDKKIVNNRSKFERSKLIKKKRQTTYSWY